MNEMVERVARHLHLTDLHDEFPDCAGYTVAMTGEIWSGIGAKSRNHYLRRARAAIAAMREPDTGMLTAACKAMSPGKRPTQARVSCRQKHKIRYQAMIDAALTEKKSSA